MTIEGKPLTAAEFQHWLKPADALERLPLDDWGRGHATDAILTNLEVGGIRAVARRGLIMDGAERQQVEFCTLDPEFWDDGRWVHGPEALWVTGNASFHRGSRLAEALRGAPEEWIEHIFTDVRFDPNGFETAFGAPSVADQHDGDDSFLSPLSDKALAAWADLFNEVYPAGSEAAARQSVNGMFPDKHISRARLRRFLPDRQRGRPRKDHD